MLRVDARVAGPRHCEVVEAGARRRIVLARVVEETAVLAGGELGQEGGDRRLDIAEEGQVEPRAAAERLGTDVDLRHLSRGRVEIAVGKIGAEHHERIARAHRVIARAEADQPGHADIERVLPFDMFLAAQRVHHGGGQFVGESDDFVMRAGAAAAAE